MTTNAKIALSGMVGQCIEKLALIARTKQEIESLHVQIAEIVQPAEKLKAAGKEHGETSFEEDGAKFTVGADKKVKWDSAKLMAIAQTLPWQQAVSMFKITFEMQETKYKALVDNVQSGLVSQDLLDKINDARTVEIGEVKLKKAELKD